MYERPDTRDRDFERLIRTSYGAAPPRRRRRPRSPSVSVSADTGTVVLPQPGSTGESAQEYVVEREPVTVLVPAAPVAPAPPVAAPTPAPVQPPTQAPAEPPRLPDPTPAPAPVPPQTPAPAPTPPNVLTLTPEPAPPAAAPVPLAPAPAAPAQTAPAPSAPAPVALPAGLASSPLTSADLAADMQAILSGGAASAGPAGAPAPALTGPMAAAPERPVDAPDEHGIFQKIKDSLEYSNSFDLGEVNLARNFAYFDSLEDSRATPARQPQPAVGAAPSAPAAAADADEAFWRSIPAWAFSSLPLVDGCVTGTAALPGLPEHSVPMYDTGEHVLAGGDLYPDQLPVNGVSFSYGQVIAMGDLYETPRDLKTADPGELRRLKTLIERDTAHYRGDSGVSDVKHGEWNDATNERYLALADDNYTHFSPPSVLGMTDATSKPDNKATWERYHEQAIAEMKAIVANSPNSSPAPFGPLTTNAFGDHFLTDAFAAGHLVNKEVVMERIRAAFYKPGTNSLTSAGEDFLARLAKALWARKKVRDIFSPLEMVETILLKHWNIDTENAFRKLLVAIAEREPSKVLNLPLKALHDHLNRVGIEATNDAGDGPWPLFGDGHLRGSKWLPVMRKAVKQSADNILSPEILVSQSQGPLSLDSHPAQLAKVWQYTPRPTAAGLAQIKSAFATYTDLSSATLLKAAADVVEAQSAFLAKELRKRNFLQHEDDNSLQWDGHKYTKEAA
jgi:hypothetical protein